MHKRMRRFHAEGPPACMTAPPARMGRVSRPPQCRGPARQAEPIQRYQRQHPGELLHIDIKKLGRFECVGYGNGQSNSRGGWEFVHVCIDNHSRVAFTRILPDEEKAFTRILPDEEKESAVAFLEDAVACYKSLGVPIKHVMTDHDSCHRSKALRKTCNPLGLKHIFTTPHAPETSGKAERVTPNRASRRRLRPCRPHLRPARPAPAPLVPPL